MTSKLHAVIAVVVVVVVVAKIQWHVLEQQPPQPQPQPQQPQQHPQQPQQQPMPMSEYQHESNLRIPMFLCHDSLHKP
jgi:hypothetical protein